MFDKKVAAAWAEEEAALEKEDGLVDSSRRSSTSRICCVRWSASSHFPYNSLLVTATAPLRR